MKIFLPLRQLKRDIKYLNCISRHLLGGWRCLEGAETVWNWLHECLQWPWTLFRWGSGWNAGERGKRKEKVFVISNYKVAMHFLNFDIRSSKMLWSSRKFHGKHSKSCFKSFYCFKLFYVCCSTSQFFFRKANIRKELFNVWNMNSFSSGLEAWRERVGREMEGIICNLKMHEAFALQNFLGKQKWIFHRNTFPSQI